MSKNGNARAQHGPAKPAVEWVVGVFSCIAVVALIAFLFYQALFRDDRPPDLSVVIEGVEQTANGTIVRIAVRNSGDEAAAAVSVHAVRTDVAESGMPREIEFDYVAGHAVRRGAFVFPQARILPSDLDVAIGGFVEP